MPLYDIFCVFGLITFILALFQVSITRLDEIRLVNIYRWLTNPSLSQFAKAMSARNDMEELLASLCTVITSILYAFTVIHFAQKLTDHSSDIFQHL